MKQEYRYLVTLCRHYLDGEPVVLQDSIDYSLLYKIANSHNLSAVLFCVINTADNKEIVPAVALKRFEDDFYEAIIRYDRQQEQLERLDTLLTSHQLRHVFFKGAEIKECFPVPQVRVMGDIDVLILPEERDTVKALMVQNGIKLLNANGPVYDYDADGVKLEIHTKIISGKVGNSNAEACFADAIDHAVFDGSRGVLNHDYHFAYLITHLAHHFWFYGAGVKLILDLAVMLKTFDIRLETVMDKLKEVGLCDFAEVILTVCRRWFGYGTDNGCDIEKTEAFLLSFGAFGNVNRNKAAVIERKELEEGKHNTAWKTKLRLLFPTYQQVKNIPYIRFIEGRPYLLPYAWVYRLFYNLKYRKAFVKKTTQQIGSDETNNTAQQELAYFKEIGLL